MQWKTTIAAAGDDLEGLSDSAVKLQGKRELVAGLFRDPQFGPVVMFGIGGVFTEALARRYLSTGSYNPN